MRRLETSLSLTGLQTTVGVQDGKLVAEYAADVAPSLDHTASLRNNDEYSKAGIRDSWWHCAHIPEIVILKMLKEDGFNVLASHPREIAKFLRRNKEKYGYLMTTRGQF